MAQSKQQGLTMTFLGCGTLGTAILSGILSSIQSSNSNASSSNSTPSEPTQIPTRFFTTVRSSTSAQKIKTALASYDADVTVLTNDNLKAVQEADVILLGCKPYMFKDVLGAEGIKDALKGKMLVSILAGVPSKQIEEFLYSSEEPQCRIVRAMPNTASLVRESMTVIANPEPPLSDTQSTLVQWIFERIGRVVRLPPAAMDASTALCGSGPAFMALVLEAMADGAVAMGLPRAEAQMMAAQTMRGTAALVLSGEHPAVLRDKVSTPGGCTIGGLMVLEEGAVRGKVARAVREATVVASQLGKGVTGVNGTRFIPQ